jgi:hypothetical protein
MDKSRGDNEAVPILIEMGWTEQANNEGHVVGQPDISNFGSPLTK